MSGNKSKKVYLITGFLGAGKTTLIKNIINGNSGKKIGVIVNEFGKIGVDGEILQKEGIELHEITNGSIFCVCLQATFAQSLIELSSFPIDILLIEGSGMADPSNMDAILEDIKGKAAAPLDYMGDICVVDAASIDKLVQSCMPAQKQIVYADYIIINKADKVDDKKIELVKQLVSALNPYAAIEVTNFSKVSSDILEKVGAFDKEPSDLLQSCNTPANKPSIVHVEYSGDTEESAFKSFIQSIIDDAFRIKGFFKLGGHWMHVDGVDGEFIIKPVNTKRQHSELVIFPIQEESAHLKIKEKCQRFFGGEVHEYKRKSVAVCDVKA